MGPWVRGPGLPRTPPSPVQLLQLQPTLGGRPWIRRLRVRLSVQSLRPIHHLPLHRYALSGREPARERQPRRSPCPDSPQRDSRRGVARQWTTDRGHPYLWHPDFGSGHRQGQSVTFNGFAHSSPSEGTGRVGQSITVNRASSFGDAGIMLAPDRVGDSNQYGTGTPSNVVHIPEFRER